VLNCSMGLPVENARLAATATFLVANFRIIVTYFCGRVSPPEKIIFISTYADCIGSSFRSSCSPLLRQHW
jgi:hypothetical protein